MRYAQLIRHVVTTWQPFSQEPAARGWSFRPTGPLRLGDVQSASQDRVAGGEVQAGAGRAGQVDSGLRYQCTGLQLYLAGQGGGPAGGGAGGEGRDPVRAAGGGGQGEEHQAGGDQAAPGSHYTAAGLETAQGSAESEQKEEEREEEIEFIFHSLDN